MKRVNAIVTQEVEAAFVRGLCLGAVSALILSIWWTTPDHFIEDGRKFKIFKKKFKCGEVK